MSGGGERLSMNVGYLETLGIRATKGSACWINLDLAMEKALKRFQDEVYKPAMEKLEDEEKVKP